eukprot:m51a1_g7328 hypothetical protein (197) ;mRNA; r:162726-163673
MLQSILVILIVCGLSRGSSDVLSSFPVSIVSAQFGRYVDMCGAHSVTAYAPAGSGSACSKALSDYPTPLVLEYAGAGLFAIRHESAPNVYLRANGTGITLSLSDGAGVVNLQFGVGTHELFHVVPQSDGTVGFETVLWPNVYLRLDQSKVNLQFGCVAFKSVYFANVFLRLDMTKVNLQYEVDIGPYEKFYIQPAL